MIHSRDISVVVQGAINAEETPKCLRSIRKFLPEAELILSTWIDSNLEGLDYDILVQSKDPGNVLLGVFDGKSIYNNMNRQLLSTQAGLEKANRKYILKLRSDLILTQSTFLEYFDKFQKRTNDYRLFERKILAATVFTRYNLRDQEDTAKVISPIAPFHVSDWWLFGLNEDLKTYFMNTKLADEPGFSEYFHRPENLNKTSPYGVIGFKFAPEQYFCYECFRKFFSDIYMEDASRHGDDVDLKSRKCIVNNFIIIEFKQSGIFLNKYLYSKNEKFLGSQYFGLCNFYIYEQEYKRYCDPEYEITEENLLYKNKVFGHALLRVYKHLFLLLDPKTGILKKLEQLLIGIPAAVVRLIPIFLNSLSENER